MQNDRFPIRLAGTARRAAAAAAVLLALTAGRIGAQEVSVTVRVVDARTGEAVPGADVRLEPGNLRGITDPQGGFTFSGLAGGPFVLHADALGYAEAALAVPEGDAAELTVRLAADPLVLEGLTVMGDRFRARRNAYPYTVRVMDRQDLRGSAAPSLAQFIREGGMVTGTWCGTGVGAGSECVLSRGERVRPTVFVDEAPAVGGFGTLGAYDPHEVAMVEVYRGGRMIRVYTLAYMERVARQKWHPMPIGA